MKNQNYILLVIFLVINQTLFAQWTQNGNDVQLTNPSNNLVLGLTNFSPYGGTINSNISNQSILEIKNSFSTPYASSKYALLKLSTPSFNYNISVDEFPACGTGLMHLQYSGTMPAGQIAAGIHIGPNSIVFAKGYTCLNGPNAPVAEYQFRGSTWANTLGVNLNVPSGFEFGVNNKSYFNGAVAIGTTNTTTTFTSGNYKLFVNGGIMATEVRVTTFPWPDYVFSKDYKLMSLSDVKNYITQHSHLPEVPPAKEIEENGVATGEMLSIQMKKIEELTLYIIQMEERIKSLESELKK